MNEHASSAREIIERLVKQSGITKKLAAEILHALPDIIEEGLKKDGEVRVKGLGTFRMIWTRGRMGRNPKTGERVEIHSHNRVVFLPEQAFKEYINRDNRLLSYKIIPAADKTPIIEETIPEQNVIEQYQYQPQPVTEPLPEPLPEPDSGTPSRKRRIHWIVPVAVTVIIILSLVFYFRNFHASRQSSVVSHQSTVVSHQSAVGSQQSEAQQSDVTIQSAVVDRQSSDSTIKEPEPTQNSKLRTPNSELRTQNSELISVPEGTRLFKLAREIYGNPYLWVLIYKENQDKIPDPDMLISGRELVIPVLEGTPQHLTRNDSLAVSEGYRLVYEFYTSQDKTRAMDFSKAMKRYKPK